RDYKVTGVQTCAFRSVVVEHDEETIRRADYVIDLGPGAGLLGGELVASGTPQEIMLRPESLTGQYISGAKSISARFEPRPSNGRSEERRVGKGCVGVG